MIGASVGSYRIVRQLGQGGMGAVYLGEHAMLGRAAAIKVLLPQLSQNREIVGRFFNEARATTAIRHPGIVEIYDFGFLPDGAAYIVMEMLEGESVASRLRRAGRLSISAALDIGRQTAAALTAAHARGITHRDLKPDNMFLVNDPEIGERVKLLDFGIAKLAADEGGNRTRTGVVMGTPIYMSPEQCRGTAELDHRADLYSLGCVLYELVAGRPPFGGDSAGDIIAHHLYFEPEPVQRHEASVPEPFAQLIMALLAKDPAQRPATAAEVGETLDRWRTLPPSVSSVGPHAAGPAPRPTLAPPASRVTAPTTLSGSISVVTAGPLAAKTRGSRRGIVAIGAAGLAVAAAAAVLVLRQPAATVAGTTPAPVAATTPAPARAPQPVPSSPATTTAGSPTTAAGSPPLTTAGSSTTAASPPPTTAPSPSPTTVPPPPSARMTAAAPSSAPEFAAEAPTPPASHTPARKPRASTATRHAPTPRDEPAIAAPAVVATPAPEVAAAKPAAPAQPPAPAAKSTAKPDAAAPPAPASKWGRMLGDKATADNSVYEGLLRLAKLAAENGDCAQARSYAARIAQSNAAMYRARVVTDPAIAACLRSP